MRKKGDSRPLVPVMGRLMPVEKVYTLVRQESLNRLHSIEFLVHLRRVAGKRVLVVWDGSPIHRRSVVSDLVKGMCGEVRLEALPSTPRTRTCGTRGAATTQKMSR